MKDFIATIDPSEVTYLGNSKLALEGLQELEADSILVTHCSTVVGNLCVGPCTISEGSGICLAAPNTNCMSATGDVAYCTGRQCALGSGRCNTLSGCASPLANGFCATPGTGSISIPYGV